MSDEIGSALGLAMQNLGGDAALIGAHTDDDTVTPGRIAKIGSFVIIEQMASANRAHTIGLFRLDGTGAERFKLSPERCVFMIVNRRPQLVQDPTHWFDDFRVALHEALETFAPAFQLDAARHEQQEGAAL